VDIPKLALTVFFFFTITCITDSVVWEGKLSWSYIQRTGFPIDYTAMNIPKCETRTSGYLL